MKRLLLALACLAISACADGSSDPDGGPGGADATSALCARCTVTQRCCNVGGVMACVDVTRDKNNCGMCGEVCETQVADQCASSQCSCALGAACTGGRQCCGTGGNPGCKTLTNDNLHCGRCGNACPNGQVCSNSTCLCGGTNPRACSMGEMCCGTSGCVNTQTDPNNCGGCGTICPTVGGRQLLCEGGTCKCGAGGNACPGAGTTGTAVVQCCGNQCADVCADAMNCGGCTNSCGSGMFAACLFGSCFGGGGSNPPDGGVPMGCSLITP